MQSNKRSRSIIEIDEIDDLNTRTSRSGYKYFKTNPSQLLVFKTELKSLKNQFQLELSKINDVCLINDECCELRRTIQLNKEETIADLKKSNGFDINDEDISKLPVKLKERLQSIENKTELMILNVDDYEKRLNLKLISNSENKTKLIQDINKIIHTMTNNDLENKKLEFYDLLNKLKLLIFNNTQLIFIETTSNLLLKKSILIDKSNILIDFEIKNGLPAIRSNKASGNSSSNLLYKRLETGMYVISYSFEKKNFIVIYDPNSNEIVKQMNLDKKIFSILTTAKNKILLKYRLDSRLFCLLMNHCLEIELNAQVNFYINGADDKYLYCLYKYRHLTIYDWYFNEIKTNNIKFQSHNTNIPFYIDKTSEIYQIEIRNNNIIIRFKSKNEKCIQIFDLVGNSIRKIPITSSIFKSFKIDSKNRLIIFLSLEKKLNYYDLDGDLIKETTINCLDEKMCIEDFIVFSNGDIYFSSKIE